MTKDDDEKDKIVDDIEFNKPTKEDLLSMLDEMVKSYEQLPPLAMSTYITHYDMLSVLFLMRSLFNIS